MERRLHPNDNARRAKVTIWIFEGPSLSLVGHMLGVTAAGLLVVGLVWRRGLRA